MLWNVTIAGSRLDIERLVAEFSSERLRVDPDNTGQAHLMLTDPRDDAHGSEEGQAAKILIEATVDRLNGLGKLRWGRVFGGVTLSAVKSVDASGRSTQYVYVRTAVEHMLPEDFADMVERLGHPRPAIPDGWEEIKTLDLPTVQELAESNPAANRALHLLALALTPDELDWVAAYSALEVVTEDLRAKAVDGQSLGLWSSNELSNFKATANSPEVLGFRARHGKKSGLQAARMTEKDATWFLRRVVARWVRYVLDQSTSNEV